MALLRPGRCGFRTQGGCLKHRIEAQRQPKGQDAGGTPALPGVAVPAVGCGVSGGRLLIWFQISPTRALVCGSFEGETTGPYAYQEQGPCPVNAVFYILNMDTQDRQDNQDEKLVHKKLTGSMIECAFVENLSVLRGPSRTPFESFPIPWNLFADSSFCPLNRSFSALGGNLFSPPNLWPIPLELSPTPSWPFVDFFFLAFVDNPQLFQISPAPALPGDRCRGRPAGVRGAAIPGRPFAIHRSCDKTVAEFSWPG